MKWISYLIQFLVCHFSIAGFAFVDKVFSGTGSFNDQLYQTHDHKASCAGNLEAESSPNRQPNYRFKLELGIFSGIYIVSKVNKFAGLPLYDYQVKFNTPDGRVGELQLTEYDSAKRLKIWASIKRSDQDFFPLDVANFNCETNFVGFEENGLVWD